MSKDEGDSEAVVEGALLLPELEAIVLDGIEKERREEGSRQLQRKCGAFAD